MIQVSTIKILTCENKNWVHPKNASWLSYVYFDAIGNIDSNRNYHKRDDLHV